MIVTCPSCATRFRLDAAVLGPTGRKLKCSRCAHQWFEGAAEEPAAPPPPPVEEEPSIPEPEPEIPDVRQRSDFAPRPRRTTRRTPALPAVRTRRRSGGLGWGLATAMAAVVIAVLVLGREQLVSFWPPAGQVYASLGFEQVDPAVGDGLELRDIVPSREEQSGVAYLVLDGMIVNISEDTIDVPQLLAVVRNAENVALQQWTFRADVASLQPGQSAAFTTRLAEPADSAADVKIEFASDAAGG